MSRLALGCALLAGLLAATAAFDQPAGLALSAVLLMTLAAGWAASSRPRSRALLALAVVLALQPMVVDAGWVVAIDVLAALVAGAGAVGWPATWKGVALTATAPLRLDIGAAGIAPAVWALRPSVDVGRPALQALARGGAIALVLVVVFGALFVTADSAFADVVDDLIVFDVQTGDLGWRVALGVLVALVAGALAWAGRPRPAGPERAHILIGRTEMLVALSALVTLFAVFVAVQLRVLFGGAGYVRATTGLGYGDYARQGFVVLLFVAALTLVVVGLAARRRDPAIRALLGALCGLTLVVLASALHRIVLVEDAYGLTQVRYLGHAIVLWLAAVFVLVLVAGVDRRVARLAPRIALVGSLVAALGFSLSDPDARIAGAAVDRFDRNGTLDVGYLETLSADAVPALQRLPAERQGEVLRRIRERLDRADGLAGLNLSRARARARLGD